MRKSSIAAYCITFCLLSAVPGNQGSKLLESLSCFIPYPQETLVCTWTENKISRMLLNMSLVNTTDKYLSKSPPIYNISCLDKRMINSSMTHSTWTCNVPFGMWTGSDLIYFRFEPGRNLETKLNTTQERDEAKPQNLRCADADGAIACSWRIREEIAESIDFDLFYGNGEETCEPQCQQEASKYLSCHCNVSNNGHLNTSAFFNTISVKPRKLQLNYTKSFKLCLIYKLPPRNLTINETKAGEVFLVSWKNTAPEQDGFTYEYELCYWNQSERKLQKVPDYCPDKPIAIGISQDPSKIFQLHKDLKPSSNYSLMIRAHLKKKGESHCYQGPWSEWSQVKTLTTKAVPNPILLYVLIPISVIVLVMLAFCGYRALVRYKKKWEERIPNPNKSAIIKGLQKTQAKAAFSNGLYFPYGDHLYVEPYNNAMMWTSADSKDSPHVYQNVEHISRLDSDLISEQDTECSMLSDLKEDYPTASIVDDYKPFTDITEEPKAEDTKEPEFMFSAFDGPYLFSDSNL